MNPILASVVMMVAVGGILGLILGIAGQVFYVQPDERTEQVLNMLPGYNCGACGYPGCAGMAEGLVGGEVANVSLCKPSNADQRKQIATYLNETPGPDGKTLPVKP